MFLKNSNLPKPVKFVLLTLILIAVYLIIAIPFKVISIISGFTDIRPVMLLKPVFGVFFGIPGCFAFAIGNLIGDIMSDSLRWSSIAGFAANFLAPFIFYLFFVKFAKTEFSLRTGKDLLKQLAVVVVSSVVETLIIAPSVKLIYPEVEFNLLSLTIFLNGTAFPLLLGIPLMILMQEELGFMPLKRKTKQ
jgi:energy-coupling factor transport system substrate-specific component